MCNLEAIQELDITELEEVTGGRARRARSGRGGAAARQYNRSIKDSFRGRNRRHNRK